MWYTYLLLIRYLPTPKFWAFSGRLLHWFSTLNITMFNCMPRFPLNSRNHHFIDCIHAILWSGWGNRNRCFTWGHKMWPFQYMLPTQEKLQPAYDHTWQLFMTTIVTYCVWAAQLLFAQRWLVLWSVCNLMLPFSLNGTLATPHSTQDAQPKLLLLNSCIFCRLQPKHDCHHSNGDSQDTISYWKIRE